jgi:peroxiredoxin family protein
MSNNIEIPNDVVVTNEDLQQEFSNRDLRTKGAQHQAMTPTQRSSGVEGSGVMLSSREVMEFEYHIRDLKIELSKKEKTIRQLEVEIDLIKEETADTGIKYFACQRDRDLLKLKCERLEKQLKEAGLWEDEETEK